MGLPTKTVNTYDSIGNREDLSDIIYDISPTATPFLSAIPKTDATAVKHEWLTSKLAAPSGSNFVLEGDDATTDDGTSRVRVFNYCAISDKVAQVSRTQEKVKSAGRKSDMASEMKNKMSELKKDVETILLQNVAYVAGSKTVARKCAGAMTYIKTNSSKASDATASSGNGSDAHTPGTARDLTEAMLETVLASAWDNGGEPTLGILNSFQKRKVAAFDGSQTTNRDGNSKKVVNSVDIYIDPLGNEVRFVPCRQAPTDAIMIFDPEHVAFSVLDDFQKHDLAKTGDSDRKQIVVEYTLEMRNEAAHCGIFDLKAS